MGTAEQGETMENPQETHQTLGVESQLNRLFMAKQGLERVRVDCQDPAAKELLQQAILATVEAFHLIRTGSATSKNGDSNG